MTAIARYVLSVICTAALCGFVQVFFHKSGYLTSLMKLITGLVLSIVVLSPVVNIDTLDLNKMFEHLPEFSQTTIADGQEKAAAAMRDIIKERTQTYILQQAEVLGINITAEVTVSQEDIPQPSAVVIIGNTSPYARKKLESILMTDLGIAEENQIWI